MALTPDQSQSQTQAIEFSREKEGHSLHVLASRLPGWREIPFVFGGVVFAIYGWAVRGFLYQVSSLYLYHTLGEIFNVFFYLMAFALLESLFVMGALILAAFILPGKWFKEGFIYKGFIAAWVGSIAMIRLEYYLFSLNYAVPSMSVLYGGMGIALLVLLVLLLLFQNILRLQRFLLMVEERMQIFTYLYIPLGILSLILVLLRTN
ncbi:MAG: hypothetical protein HYZ21_16100 [Chloroflexi bacterium]|nr:hypothetical protein [Chloroflexota bacterium]